VLESIHQKDFSELLLIDNVERLGDYDHLFVLEHIPEKESSELLLIFLLNVYTTEKMKKVAIWVVENRRLAVLLLFGLARLISAVRFNQDLKFWPSFVSSLQWASLKSLDLDLDGRIAFHNNHNAAKDFGNRYSYLPAAVVYPASIRDIKRVVKSVYLSDSCSKLTVSAKGNAHSVQGQAQAPNGIVIEMGSLKGIQVHKEPENPYVEASAGELWIDVLRATLKHGLAPRSWTDYLYLSVGGTLSNAGISGQAFRHGPQISNVYHLQIVTGKGEISNCSREENSDLFYGALGGLGQFGIITSARIALEQAPQMVRWIRVLYSDFELFTRDQEYLISKSDGAHTFDYIEGFVILRNEALLNNWRSSMFSPQNPGNLSTVSAKGRVLYCLELTKNYNQNERVNVGQEINSLLDVLSFIPSSLFTKDIPYVDFLDRVHTEELKLRSRGLWEVPHPWLNLLIPKSKIAEFDAAVFKDMLRNPRDGPILIYPMNRNKWDSRMSAVTPNEDIFYLVAFLRSAIPSSTNHLDNLIDQNQKILSFCQQAGIGAKQYLPHHTTEDDWKTHFGEKWDKFVQRKTVYDPTAILAPGQRIFSKCRAFSVS
jgi:cytokinin dehydrogenase